MKLDWISLSCISLVVFSFMYFLITFLTRKGFSVSLVMFALSIAFTLFFFFQLLLTKGFIGVKLTPAVIGIMIVMGILSAIGNWSQFQAANDASNPGLAISIINLFVIPYTILAVIFFKDKVTLVQIIGIITSLIGVGLITVGQITH